MMKRERKEILVLDGLTILFVVMAIGNGVVSALMYRWHNIQVFNENLAHQQAYADLLKEERRLKNDIVKKEGAKSWETTSFGKELIFHTRGKKTFTSPSGATIDYPGDLVADDAERANGELSLITNADAQSMGTRANSEGPTGISAASYPKNGKTLLDWVKSSNEANFKLGNGKYQSMKVGGHEAIAYEWSGLYNGTSYAIDAGDQVFLLSVTWNDRSDDIVHDFDTILSTVRFTS